MSGDRPQGPTAAASALARLSVVNLMGFVVPLLIAFLAIPVLTRALGPERFGVLALIWVLVGYFTLFDLGLGRALTQVVSARLDGSPMRAPAIVWPALRLMLVLSVVATAALVALTPWFVDSILGIAPTHRGDTILAFRIVAAVIPALVLTTGITAILTSFNRFGALSAIRVSIGVFSFAAPLAVLPFSDSLAAIATVLAAGRLLAFVASAKVVAPVMPPRPARSAPRDGGGLGELLRFGAWVFVSNLVSPLLVYADRFVVGGLVSAAAVAYYATPQEIVARLLILPGAVAGVLFPAFATAYKRDDPKIAGLFFSSTKSVAVLQFPAAVLLIGFADVGLSWWLGPDFGRNGAPVMRWIAVGVFVNSVAQVFFTLVQAAGRPDLTAKYHLIEAPLYLTGLWWATRTFGIAGAAAAWAGRMALDAVLLLLTSQRLIPAKPAIFPRLWWGLTFAVALLLSLVLVDAPAARGTAALVTVVAYVPVAWFLVLTDVERSTLRGMRLGSVEST